VPGSRSDRSGGLCIGVGVCCAQAVHKMSIGVV
jgi:hypothetical protein